MAQHILDPIGMGSFFVKVFLTKLANFTWALLPSFIQSRFHPDATTPPNANNISALDGLRGWACMLVFNYHFLFLYTNAPDFGYGLFPKEDIYGFGFFPKEGRNYSVFQLPFLHILISGHFMVCIFFAISGYVLSFKPLKLSRSGSWDRAYQTVASSAFRRAVRLYLPSIAGIYLVMLAVQLGAYNTSDKVRHDGVSITGWNEEQPPVLDTFGDQFVNATATVAKLTDPWDWYIRYNDYNPQLWTIPIEFRSSMVLFVLLFSLLRVQPIARTVLLAGFVGFCIACGRWEVMLFVSGALIAQLDLLAGVHDAPSSAPLDEGTLEYDDSLLAKSQPSKQSQSRTVWAVVLVVGLYLGSAPNYYISATPGYVTLARLIPKSYGWSSNRFWPSIGAVMVVWSVMRLEEIQRLFTTPLAQYFAKISFAFYIVHGPLIHALGHALMPVVFSLTGKETDLQWASGMFVGWITILPIAVCMADVYWRFIDLPSVSFSRWLERRLTH